MDFAGIRAGLATAATNVSGLRGMAFLADSIEPPVWVSGEVEISYDRTFRGGSAGLVEATFTGRLYVSRADDRAGQALLDGYLTPSGSSSIKAALETDVTLGGVCKTLWVERVHGYGLWEVAGTPYMGCQFDVKVWG